MLYPLNKYNYEDELINLFKEFITDENINLVFEKYNVPLEFDLLSIDIDFNDFYVWKALDSKYRPRLVIIEYNGTHLPDEDKVVEYSPHYVWDETNYYGASILALYNLGREKGYSLIYVENRGVNLFFLRDDLVQNCEYSFKNINDVKKLYVYPKHGVGPNGGHLKDPKNRPYVKSTSILTRECYLSFSLR